MAKRRTSADIAAELKVIQDELVTLSEVDGTEDEVARALDKSNELLERFDALRVEHDEAVEYEKKVDAVRSLALNPGNRDNPGQAPEVMRKVDPFDKPVDVLTRSEARDRALKVVEQTNDEMLVSRNKDRLDGFIGRNSSHFDGDYISRRILLTENDAYRSAFMKRMIWGQEAALSADESAAVVKFQEFEIQRAMNEGTTTAGGFGVPVKVAA